MKKLLYGLMCLPLLLASCASDDPELPEVTPEPVEGSGDGGDVIGIYVLNEGNLGSNKCTLDYFSYADSTYYRNIYAENNPDQPMELGDAGNDIAIHRGRLYVVVNGSHKVEVLDAFTAKRIGQVDVSSPRNLAFRGDSVFVSSFVSESSQVNGSVVCFDAQSLHVIARCEVGAGPEEMVTVDSLLYVANSQNYGAGVFDNTLSVINMNTMKKVGSIPVATNLHHLRLDGFGNMWATSRGNYADESSRLIRLAKNDATGAYEVAETTPYGCANLALGKGMLYFYDQTYDASWNATYAFNSLRPTASGYEDLKRSFISDEAEIATPYALAVQPSNGDIFITDVKNYVSSGELRCYTAAGKLKWSATTGDIPGHIAFLTRQ